MNGESRVPPALDLDARQFSRIPAQLCELRQWLVWRLEARRGQAKPTKVPFRAGGRGLASVSDSSTWSPFGDALAAYRRGGFDGLGFVFTSDDPYCGVDFDEIGAEGSGAGWAEAWPWIRMLASYAEWSPSGLGVHVIVHAQIDRGRRSAHHGVEVYDRGRFFAMTGQPVPGSPGAIREAQIEVDLLVRLLFPPDAVGQQPTHRAVNLADEEIVARARRGKLADLFECLWAGDWEGRFGSQSEADLSLCAQLFFWTSGDAEAVDRLFRASGLWREKWDEPRGDATYGQRTVARAARAVSRVYDPAAYQRGALCRMAAKPPFESGDP
jgi:putative DNA primase/helicase